MPEVVILSSLIAKIALGLRTKLLTEFLKTKDLNCQLRGI